MNTMDADERTISQSATSRPAYLIEIGSIFILSVSILSSVVEFLP